MATHKSALKEHRQSLARREQNRVHRSRLRTAIKKYRHALAQGDVEQARKMLPGVLSLVDHTTKLNALHANAANRQKSRLTRALQKHSAGA
jgi:small subunit ribosomal protein S20